VIQNSPDRSGLTEGELASGWHIRTAVAADIPVLVALRRLMFVEMGYRDETGLSRMAEASTRYMEQELPSGEFRAWVAEAGAERRAVASIGLVIHRAPPTVRNLAGREGYIMNLVTLPEWRRQGIATALLRVVLDTLRAEGTPVAALHASAAGRAMYERVGFAATNEMRLRLESGG
jgi:ribosomal protein S18 acetylase RimI-like enzyme